MYNQDVSREYVKESAFVQRMNIIRRMAEIKSLAPVLKAGSGLQLLQTEPLGSPAKPGEERNYTGIFYASAVLLKDSPSHLVLPGGWKSLHVERKSQVTYQGEACPFVATWRRSSSDLRMPLMGLNTLGSPDAKPPCIRVVTALSLPESLKMRASEGDVLQPVANRKLAFA